MLYSFTLFIYSRIVLPGLYLLANVAALFIPVLRSPVFGRRKTIPSLENYMHSLSARNNRPRVLIHAASMGEFEHIKPLIARLTNVYKARIIVTFFSPSGFNHVKEFPGVDLFIYAPFDFPGMWKKFYQILKPNLLIISKHDVWTNQVFQAKEAGVPVILANASLGAKSGRVSPIARFLLRPVYQQMDKVFAIAEADKNRLQKLFKLRDVMASGDTKFDQVLIRKEQKPPIELLPQSWVHDHRVLIFGSIWPQGAEVVLAGITELLNEFPNLRVVIAPHEPNAENFKNLLHYFPTLKPVFFTSRKISAKSRVVFIDTIGILADLYRYAHIAYVGGGFKQGIHNVMEAAAYDLPVIFGPVNQNASEAGALVKSGGGFVVDSNEKFKILIRDFLQNEDKRLKTGLKAGEFAARNTGATNRILNDPSVIKALTF